MIKEVPRFTAESLKPKGKRQERRELRDNCLVEVLILKGLREWGDYKRVTGAGGKGLDDWQGPAGGES
jgi:hypothetical protein